MSKFYKNNPVLVFRICACDECDSLGELSDEEESNEDNSGTNEGTK